MSSVNNSLFPDRSSPTIAQPQYTPDPTVSEVAQAALSSMASPRRNDLAQSLHLALEPGRLKSLSEETSFEEILDFYVLEINKKFKTDLSFSPEQVRCLEEFSDSLLFMFRPLSEFVGSGLLGNLQCLRRDIDRLDLGSQERAAKLKELLNEDFASNKHCGDLDDKIENDRDGETHQSQDCLKIVKQNLGLLKNGTNAFLAFAAQNPPKDPKIIENAKELIVKISILLSMIKIDHPKAGEIFRVELSQFLEERKKAKDEKRQQNPHITDETVSRALVGCADENLLVKILRENLQKQPKEKLHEDIIHLIDWHIPYFSTAPVFTKILNNLKQVFVNDHKTKDVTAWFESITHFIEKKLAELDTELQKETEDLGDRIYSLKYMQNVPKITKSHFHYTYILRFLKIIQYFRDIPSESLLQMGREKKFQTTLENIKECATKVMADQPDPRLVELYQDFRYFLRTVYLTNNKKFIKNASAYLDDPSLSFESFRQHAKLNFTQQTFDSELQRLHKKHSEKLRNLSESDANLVKMHYLARCLECCNLILIQEMLTNQQSNLDDFLHQIPLELIQLDESAPLEFEEDLPPKTPPKTVPDEETQTEKKGPKIKTRKPSTRPLTVSEPQGNDVQPTIHAPLDFPRGGEIKRRKALELLREHFGWISVEEGGNHSLVRTQDGRFAPLPRKRKIKAGTFESAMNILKNEEKR